jgi:predicted RNA-binding protein associated with RNAse of E/G family
MKIQKKNLAGEVVFQYEGEVLNRTGNAVTIQAYFGREDMPLVDIVLRKGDLFIETFYTDRWYNIFEIYDRDDQILKGRYCNICMPATMDGEAVSYVDLALDLWVAPDGKQTVLDEDELNALNFDQDLKEKVYAALRKLQTEFKTRNPPS